MTAPQTTTRNASLEDLVAALRLDHARKLDIVTPAANIHADRGHLVITGSDAVITEDGVTLAAGRYSPTQICDSGIAQKLDIPPGYLSRCRRDNLPLYDENINGWLGQNPTKPYLVRCFTDGEGGGIARALLSDSYKPIENIDVLMAALDGIRNAGVPVDIAGCDLTDRRMYVRVTCESVSALAPTLLAGYRSPYTGLSGADNPIVFAGFEIANSEVGLGAFTITPRLVVQVCRNGMTIKRDAMRAQHLGAKLEAGIIRWSDDTNTKNLELVTAQTRDAVTTFLDTGYVTQKVEELERISDTRVVKPEETIRKVAADLRYSQAQQDDILAMFIRGGAVTTGGVMHAVTASAQNQPDADLAADMEGDALRVLELAYLHRG